MSFMGRILLRSSSRVLDIVCFIGFDWLVSSFTPIVFIAVKITRISCDVISYKFVWIFTVSNIVRLRFWYYILTRFAAVKVRF